MVNKTP